MKQLLGNENEYVRKEKLRTKTQRRSSVITTEDQLVRGSTRAFRQETQALRRYSHGRLSHAHLITLLVTYEHRGKFHLIFPLASSDLLGYWENVNPRPETLDYNTVKWLARQCTGVAAGLCMIHRHPTSSDSSLFPATAIGDRTIRSGAKHHLSDHPVEAFGHHCDIKPANLLWFPGEGGSDMGTIKITDFGLTRFSRDENGMEIQGYPNSPTYRPPECEFPDGRIRCSYDIWALGCLFLEFTAWYFGGWELVQSFKRKRKDGDERPLYPALREDTFFTLIDRSKSQAQVKTVVTEVCKDSFQR